MDKYRYGNHHVRVTDNPSFSSTLLDAIYRSIDEPQHKFTTLKHKHANNDARLPWMETKPIPLPRRSAADFQKKLPNDDSSSTSSDSSCAGGIFSSSELQSLYGFASSRTKPIRTSLQSSQNSNKQFRGFDNYYRNQNKNSTPVSQQKPKQEGGFVKTKSRALKIYGDMKKVQQPISPGGRLATFLNSLFTPKNTKNTKIPTTSATSYDDVSLEMKSKSAQTSTCSSASSFSQSCLSKTLSTNVKSSNGAKRSVHFYPVSVIVDEDLKPDGHKSVQPSLRDVRSSEEKNWRGEKYWQNMNLKREFVMRNTEIKKEELDDDDDDCVSCGSSDLFELDSLRYVEELPVYETTHFDRNLAIGMIL